MNDVSGSDNSITFGEPLIICSPDRLDRLLDLIHEFCMDTIDGWRFRERFVIGFASLLCGEPLDSIVMAIEGIYADAGVCNCSERQLQDQLFTVGGIVEAMQMIRPPRARRFFRNLDGSERPKDVQ